MCGRVPWDEAKMKFRGRALRTLTFIFLGISYATSFAAPKPDCPEEFASFKLGSPVGYSRDLKIEQAVDYMVQLESQIESSAKLVRGSFTDSRLPVGLRNQMSGDFERELSDIKKSYESLVDKSLEWSVAEAQVEFAPRAEALRRSAESLFKRSRIAIRRESGATFAEMMDNPELISSRLIYEVPQADSSTGAHAANKLSVRFHQSVIDELRKDHQSSARFFRAMIKGYVGTHSGDGILRITDAGELVEVKHMAKNHRLIGCRRPGGLIELVRYHEKHNDGGSGSLKQYAKLCH